MLTLLLTLYFFAFIAQLLFGGMEVVLLGLTACLVVYLFKVIHRHNNPIKEPKPEVFKFNSQELADITNSFSFSNDLRMEIGVAVQYPYSRDTLVIVKSLGEIFKFLPPHRLLKYDVDGDSIGNFLDMGISALDNDERIELNHSLIKLGGNATKAVRNIRVSIDFPQHLRNEHMHIVAGSGHGKTQLLQSMILDDLDKDCSLVVIDSQGDLINKLATRIPLDRLILIDPETCPPALNLFAGQSGEKETGTAIELYEYIFSALDSTMTSKQRTAYRFVCRLLLIIPHANIHTMRELLEKDGTTKYQDYIDQMGTTAQAFFDNEYNTRQFADTRKEILRRLYTVLENTTLENMLGAGTSSLNIPKALDSGKVILISTAKSFLKQTGSSLFGRIFIAQVMQAVMARGENRKRTYLYLDEFQDYAEDSHILFNLFEQARKYNLGMVVAHQYLGQLPPKLQQSLASNTSIKFAGGVSAEDSRKLAGQMRCSPEQIANQDAGDFAGYFKNYGTVPYSFELGRLENTPELNNISAIREEMRNRYSNSKLIDEPILEVAEPEAEPYAVNSGLSFDGFEDRS